jgi:phosphoenolpyruvate-protein kinase (PTS system EI component)
VTGEVRTPAARGIPVGDGPAVEGVLIEATGPDDVINLLDSDLSEVIVLIHSSGTSMLAPIFADLNGVVCTTGGEGSHVAIIAREFGVPCLVAAEFLDDDVLGKRVRIEGGDLFIIDT